MAALPWTEAGDVEAWPTRHGWWLRHGRSLTCGASALLILPGFLLDATQGGSFVAALIADAGFAVEIIMIYVGAVLANGWVVFPAPGTH